MRWTLRRHTTKPSTVRTRRTYAEKTRIMLTTVAVRLRQEQLASPKQHDNEN